MLNLLGINIIQYSIRCKKTKYNKIIGDRSIHQTSNVSIIGNTIKVSSNGIAIVIKHIPGHGLAKSDSHKPAIVKQNIKQLTN